MKRRIAISVIIPAYNAEKYIGKCLESVRGQSAPDVEILCVDDGSADTTSDIVRACAQKTKNLRLIRHEENRGQAYARNCGLREAAGKYVYFLDADDMLQGEDSLQRMYELAEKEELDCVTFGSEAFYEDLAARTEYPTALARHASYEGVFDGEAYLKRLFDSGDFKPAVWMQFWNREFLQKQGLCFDEELPPCEDLLFTVCAFCRAGRIGHLNRVMHRYLCRTDSSSREVNLNLYRVHALCYFHIQEFCLKERVGTDTFAVVTDYCRSLKDCVMDMAIALIRKGVDIRTAEFANPGYGVLLAELLTGRFLRLKRFFAPQEYEVLRKSGKIIVYGAGTLGKDTEALLAMFGLENFVTAANHRWGGAEEQVVLEELTEYREDAVVLIAASRENLEKRIAKVTRLGFRTYICMDQ
ncbi:MAG: glycosyltransferase family 2 protein [Eubacteriales bacterium]|nr:glycosyltransferase family 2 protein [Eubacteriales bacterium]